MLFGVDSIRNKIEKDEMTTIQLIVSALYGVLVLYGAVLLYGKHRAEKRDRSPTAA
jgi:hypothetical protein